MTDKDALIRVAVIFGGRSVEHQVSVLTGLEVLHALDTRKYDPVPVYISLAGDWYTGDALYKDEFYHQFPASREKVTQVTLEPYPRQKGLILQRTNAGLASRIKALFSPQIIPIDIVVPALHGTLGEDGCIQGLLEMVEIPYTGCGVESASIAMNKAKCKEILRNQGIPVLPDIIVKRDAWRANPADVHQRINSAPSLASYPFIVKPCNLGSSIGISIAQSENSIDTALAEAFAYDSEAIIEPLIEDITEINVSVLEGSPNRASVVEAPSLSGGLLTFEDKYVHGDSSKKGGRLDGMSGMDRRIDPSELSSSHKADAQKYALQAFSSIGCLGVARIDFILDNKTNQLYLNEMNTLPGSMAHYLWEHSDPSLSYTNLLTQMINNAFKRHASSLNRETEPELTLF